MAIERRLQPLSLGLICTLLGLILGFLVVNYNNAVTAIQLISLPGVFWIHVLHFVGFPLAFTSLTTAVTSLKRKLLGKIVWQASLYFLGMNFLAAVVGIVLALVFEPGRFNNTMATPEQRMGNSNAHSMRTDTVFEDSAFIGQNPKNVPDATRERFLLLASLKIEGITELSNMRIVTPCPMFLGSFFMVILASIASGYLIDNMKKKGRLLAKSLRIINDYVIQESTVLTWFAPIGIGSLLATRAVEMDEMSDLLSRLGTFLAIVSIGLLIHAVVTIPFIFFLVTRRHPFAYLSGAKEVIMIASGTGSSFATLPALVQGLQFHNKKERHVSCFILPLATRLKPDGLILYQIITVVSIAQFNNMDTNFGIILLLCLAAVVICITTGGTLSSAIVSVVVLQTVNIPLRGMEFVFAATWLTDRLCTVVDVMSTIAGMKILQSLSHDELTIHALQEKRSRTWPQIEV